MSTAAPVPPRTEAKPQPLLIGIGNRLRGDDGAGPQLIDALAADGNSRLQTLAVHQLTPELAAVVAGASAVLFVDASLVQPRLALTVITAAAPGAGKRNPGHGGGCFSHQLTPAQLLALSRAVYGAQPPAWQLLIPAERLEPGGALSPTTRSAIAVALRLLRRWRARHA